MECKLIILLTPILEIFRSLAPVMDLGIQDLMLRQIFIIVEPTIMKILG